MTILSLIRTANILIFVASIKAFSTSRWINRPNTALTTINTRLFLKATSSSSDRSSHDSRHPVKTGTHTYASWRSPDEQETNPVSEIYDDDNDIENFDSRSDNDYDRDTDGSEAPSPLLVWLRKLYDSMFFYGLDPAPAAQKSNRQKMMRDAENYDSRKNTSPFFTPSEQRVQRYMTSMRNRDTSRAESAEIIQRTKVEKASSRRRYSDPVVRGKKLDDSAFPNVIRPQKSEKKIVTPQAAISVIEEKIEDRVLELELADAEIATLTPADKGYSRLLTRRSSILDDIEDLEVELVDAKSGMS